MKTQKITQWIFAILLFLFIAQNTLLAQVTTRDFWGTGVYLDRSINSSDVIRAYDPQGVDCTPDGVSISLVGGVYYYLAHVKSDDASTTADEGAVNGDAITFKINGVVANVVSGSNIWETSVISKECNIEVPPDITPHANAGGPYTGNEGASVQFNGSNSQNAVSYAWNFGDGGTGTGATPTHTYADEKTYTVTLTITNSASETDQATTTATISNVAPTVEAGSNQTGLEGQSFSFSGTATDPGVNDVLSYSWNFGDGGTASGKNTTHTFTDNNTYTVTLTVSDGDGGQGSDQLTVTTANVAPTANINGPYNGVINQPTQFTATASDPGTSDVLTYTWDFDNDGQYDDGTGATASYTYYTAGSYPVKVKVTDDDGASDTDESTATIVEAVQITLAANPSGRTVKVDGTTYNTPATFYWAPGTQHSVEAISPQYPNATQRYVFSSWSDGKSRIHTYTTPTNNETLTAQFTLQYNLAISSDHGAPWGDGYYNVGQSVDFGVSSQADYESSSIRYLFVQWNGSGNGSYSGTDLSSTVQVNNAITETAVWNKQYFLQVSSNPTAGGATTIDPLSTDGWYDENAEVQISATPSSPYQWGSWSGDYTGTDNPATITMNGPKTIAANFLKETSVTVATDPPGRPFTVDDSTYTTSQTFVWRATDTHTLAITSPQEGTTGTRYLFKSWSDGGAQSHTYHVPGDDQTITATFNEQHYVAVQSESNRGNPTGTGWYNTGSIVPISIDSLYVISANERYLFVNWQGTGSESYSGIDRAPNLVVKGPITQTAVWQHEYKIKMNIDPSNGGTILPFEADTGWATANQALTLTAVGNSASGYGFSSWSGDITGDTNPYTINALNGPKEVTAHFVMGTVIVKTVPSGLKVIIDGVEKVSPVVYNWAGQENHNLAVSDPQGDAITTQYKFSSWSDGGGQNHVITTSGVSETFIATFLSHFYIDVVSDYGTPTGESWYPEGETARLSVDSLITESATFRRRFKGWTGTGKGGVASSTRVLYFPVTGPATERAQWVSQFKATVSKSPAYASGIAVNVSPAGPWYDKNTILTLSAEVQDTAYTFLGWDGVGDALNPAQNITVTVDEAKTITAMFDADNYPPQIHSLPDRQMAEDAILKIPFSELMSYVEDANDPLDELTVSFQGGAHFQVSVDSTKELIVIQPEADWNGESQFYVQVQDGFGAVDRDTFKVKVHPIPDPPGAFRLVSPDNNYLILYWNDPISFVWTKSKNVDPDDVVTYSFIFSPNADLSGTETIGISIGQDTTVTLLPQSVKYLYWGVRAEDTQGNYTWCDKIFNVGVDEHGTLPDCYQLSNNYPNPFNPDTRIPFQLPQQSDVRITIFDIRGRQVAELVNGKMDAGFHEVIWDGKNAQGIVMSTGIYFIRMEAQKYVARKKILLLK